MQHQIDIAKSEFKKKREREEESINIYMLSDISLKHK